VKKALLPLNISLLIPTKEQLRLVLPITSLDITDGPGGSFHDDGLFSTQIFGRVGDPARDRTFGYIDLKVPVFHPIIFRTLVKLRGLYGGILSGMEYATWNPTKRDFDPSNELDGETGYDFFYRHWQEIEFAKTNSDIRNVRITLIEKYRDQAAFDKLLVLPAGLRDAEIDSDGRMSMDEINEYYQGVLMLVRNFPDNITPKGDLSMYNRTRYALMLRVASIYDHIETLISGKHGFIQGRWASRRVFNGTRNVISSLDTTTADLDQPNRPKFNDTVVGLYQAAKAVLPKTIYHLKNSTVVGEIFDTTSNRVELVNAVTLNREWVDISNQDMDRWGTEEGLEKVVEELSIIEKRSRPVEIAGHYLALVYVDNQQGFRVIRDITELPADRKDINPKWVRPITYMELIYLAGLSMWNTNSAFVTRYPVENLNSSIPSKLYVKTTVTGQYRKPLGPDWEIDHEAPAALEYPVFVKGVVPQYHDSTSISPARLAPLGADFDGDTVSVNALYSKEAIEESDRFFKTRAAYIQAGGGLSFSVGIHTLKLTLLFMTGQPRRN
jgi:hypothetical protein